MKENWIEINILRINSVVAGLGQIFNFVDTYIDTSAK